jgi:ribose transport system ATP-binding protein
MTVLDDQAAGRVTTLSVRGVTKTFGAMKALDRADLDVHAGEIVGLLGSNGSGKSTLIKILAGFHTRDEGEVFVEGKPVSLGAGGDARDHGLRFVHQDLGLIASLTVLENLVIERLATTSGLRVNWRAERARARRLFTDYGLDIDPDAVVESLAPVQRAMLAIVRATADFQTQGGITGRGVLVLDEPTVFLAASERTKLFDLVRRLVVRGVGIVFVSHDLEEVRELCDTAVVLRDGKVAGRVRLDDVDDGEIVRLIVGRSITQYAGSAAIPEHGRSAILEISNVSGGSAKGVSLDVRRGEILGLTGLAGSGYDEIPYLLFGAKTARQGQAIIDGTNRDLRRFSPHQAIDAGMVLVPADRAADAVVADLSLAENISLPVLSRFVRGGLLRGRAIRKSCEELLRRFRVKPPRPEALLSELSGGNQQRAVLAKWLNLDPRVLLLHEPTQGVDVGARQDIFTALRAAADEGVGVVCASSDHDQLGVLCDRVLVFRNGRPDRELAGEQVNRHSINEACLRAA